MKKKLFLILSVFFLSFSIINVNAEINYYTNANIPLNDYGTFVTFDENMTFDTLYHTGDFVYIDDYKFSVQNANMTINSFYENNLLNVTLSNSTDGQSIFVFDTSSSALFNNAPNTVLPEGVTWWSNSWASQVLTITSNHTSPVTYEIWFNQNPSGGDDTVPDTDDNSTSPDDNTIPPPLVIPDIGGLTTSELFIVLLIVGILILIVVGVIYYIVK